LKDENAKKELKFGKKQSDIDSIKFEQRNKKAMFVL